MIERDQLASLLTVISLRIAQQEASLAPVVARLASIRDRLNALDGPLEDAPSPMETQVALRHGRWRAHKRQTLNREMALLRATELDLREALNRMRAQAEALEELDAARARSEASAKMTAELEHLLALTLQAQTS